LKTVCSINQNSSLFKQINKQKCLDVVKENPPRKPSRDPRRLASNSRLAVSLGTFFYTCIVMFYDFRARS